MKSHTFRTLNEIIETLQLGISHTSDGTGKGWPKGYINTIYAPLLEGSRYRPDLRVLEIGIRSGASLALWAHFFPKVYVIGLDNRTDVIQPRSEWISGHNVATLTLDAYRLDAMDVVDGEFDLIVDDGPNTLESQLWAARHWAARLAPDGILVIEDVQGGLCSAVRILGAVEPRLEVCFHIVDLRRRTGQGDALAVCIHSCAHVNCELPITHTTRKILNGGLRFRLQVAACLVLLPLRRLLRHLQARATGVN